jgi:hypothetical protein
MKRLVMTACLAAVCLMMLPSCGVVMVTAPPGSDVRLLPELETASAKVTVKNWYVLWGLVPITPNNTSDVIARNQMKNVRVKTYFSVVDWLINAVLGGLSIYTNTVDIEGNLK